ncbi:MotA/TolQ/ExbB proton channel [Syntrophobacter sp. SbD1]|nr:MotA/TolQ/ExbB proton channel [Syntrophobacter sp. SbD1]
MFTQFLTATAYAADLATPYQRSGDSVLDMIFNAGPMVKFVLLILMALSIGCWCVIVLKYRLIRRANRESGQFISLFRQRKNYSALYRDSEKLSDSHLAEIFRVGYAELSRLGKSLETKNLLDLSASSEVLLENVERAINGGMTSERQRLERFLPLLATTGSTAPFIGLFGTVWGIMTSFQQIGIKGAANLAVVAPGISEALIATAIGLGAAIPAVVAYNHFSNKIRGIENEMSQFSADYLNMLKRDLMRKGRQEEAVPSQANEPRFAL